MTQSLFETLRTRNREVVNRGVMRAPFVVLVATEMPAILAEVAPRMETVSLDEAFLDLKASLAIFGSVESLAARIKDRIREETSLPITVTEDPLSTVALGSGKALDNLEFLREVVIP